MKALKINKMEGQMNKTAIKNFAIWARQKLIDDISYKAGLVGITEKGINPPLMQSTKDIQFFDIGGKEPFSITGIEIRQREKLVQEIKSKEVDSDYSTAYKSVIEEVAYTWFNRLIAVRFMEVNDYLPSKIRVLSSEAEGKSEPDIVTTPFEADLDYTDAEKQRIVALKGENQLDQLFCMLFIKQCNALNEVLPQLFEKTSDYTELLLNIAFTDKEGIVYHLVNDIEEDDFNVEKEGQVEIIGWMYQYYNTELNEIVYDGSMNKKRITKELLPAATTIYTPDWAIKYMVENSLGKLWLELHSNESLKSKWKYYLGNNVSEEKQTYNKGQFEKIEDIKIIDPCMGSGHILVYCFEVLMQIYESCGYSQKEAAKSILENNIYGLDIDKRAQQLAYFAVMMKARQYNRRIFKEVRVCNIYCIDESNTIDKNKLEIILDRININEYKVKEQLVNLVDNMIDAKEYGSILHSMKFDWKLLKDAVKSFAVDDQVSLYTLGIDETKREVERVVRVAEILSDKYDVVITNPPYLSNARFDTKLFNYVNKEYSDVKNDLSMVMYKKAIQDFAKDGAFIAFITTSSWLTIKSFEKLREYVLENIDFESLIDFGTELFEGKVGHNPIVAWINRKQFTNKQFTAIRLVEYCYSRRNEKEMEFFNSKNRYFPEQSSFSNIPGKPIAYWIGEVEIFNEDKLEDRYSSGGRNKTHNNEKFIRYWWEITDRDRWKPYAKGGEFRRWYGNEYYVVDWSESAKAEYDSHGGLYNQLYAGKEGICWSLITSYKTGFRIKRKEFHYDSASPVIFNKNYEIDKYDLGLLNSKVAEMILDIYNPTMNMGVSYVLNMPCIVDENKRKIIEKLVDENIVISKSNWDYFENSLNYSGHPFLKHIDHSIESTYGIWQKNCEEQFVKLKRNETEINRVFIGLYKLQRSLLPEVEDKDITIIRADLQRDIRSFISYAVGCMFGRYSLNVEGLAYAGGEWDDSKYSTFIPDKNNIIPITDEEYFEDDIVGLFVAFVKKTFGEATLEENLDFIAQALGNKGNSSREIIRNYFIKDFFKDHCKVYQKRPIYWLFDSGKQNGFKALIYMHRYDENTIGNLRIDYLHKMQRIYDSEISRMQEMKANSGNAREIAAAEKRKEKLTKQLKEAREYDEKIAHLAVARISIDLDDGVKVNYEKVQTGTDGKKLEVLAKI